LNYLALILATAGLAVPCRASCQSPASEHASASAADSPSALRPGDAIRLRIWQEPDLSGEFQVDQRGMATLPLLGEFAVTGVAGDSIRPQLLHAYTKYLRNPTIEVTLLRRVTITGAVAKPGIYPVDPTMTVTDALALAGGAAPDGKRDRVELRRDRRRVQANLNQNDVIGTLSLRSGDELYVPQKGWVSRNPWLVTSLIGATATITAILVTRK
jgi:protein involved in polysaccharide export with SLBB domain